MSDGVAPALRRPADQPSGRAAWHRRVGVLPLGYLAAIVAVGFVHRSVRELARPG